MFCRGEARNRERLQGLYSNRQVKRSRALLREMRDAADRVRLVT